MCLFIAIAGFDGPLGQNGWIAGLDISKAFGAPIIGIFFGSFIIQMSYREVSHQKLKFGNRLLISSNAQAEFIKKNMDMYLKLLLFDPAVGKAFFLFRIFILYVVRCGWVIVFFTLFVFFLLLLC